MKVEVSSFCDTGQKRKQNQDAILVHQDPSLFLSLFLVADGMGGYANGGQASGAIVSGIKDWLTRTDLRASIGSTAVMLNALRDQLTDINTCILTTLSQGQICGSTCATLIILRESYGVLSVGDSRVYLCRGFRCESITRDDVWENQKIVREKYSKRARKHHKDYGKLIHAVGTEQTLACSIETGILRPNDVFALCSDGVYKMCAPGFLNRSIMSCRWRNLETVRDSILREIYHNQAKDNASLILIRCR